MKGMEVLSINKSQHITFTESRSSASPLFWGGGASPSGPRRRLFAASPETFSSDSIGYQYPKQRVLYTQAKMKRRSPSSWLIAFSFLLFCAAVFITFPYTAPACCRSSKWSGCRGTGTVSQYCPRSKDGQCPPTPPMTSEIFSASRLF